VARTLPFNSQEIGTSRCQFSQKHYTYFQRAQKGVGDRLGSEDLAMMGHRIETKRISFTSSGSMT
jgi:hypothetical protein